MTMNYSTTMRFIELMRSMPGLWDRNCKDYLNKDMRQQLRVLISREMGLTVDEVGKKIQNLRTYYVKECLKRDRAQYAGQSYEPRWPYFDALDAFWGYDPIVRKKTTDMESAFMVYMDDNSDTQEEDIKNSDSNSSTKRFILDEPEFDNEDSTNDISDAKTSSSHVKRIKTEQSPEPRSADCASASTTSASSNDDVSREQRLSAQTNTRSTVPASVRSSSGIQRPTLSSVADEDDEDKLFVRYLVKELKLIKSFRTKQLTKLKIQQLVTYAQLDMDDPSLTPLPNPPS